jgi:hypothetical protein
MDIWDRVDANVALAGGAVFDSFSCRLRWDHGCLPTMGSNGRRAYL